MRSPAKPRLDTEEQVPVQGAETSPAAPGDEAGTEPAGSASPGVAGTSLPPPGGSTTVPGESGSPDTVTAAPQPAYVPAEPEPVTDSPDDLRGQTEIQVMNELGSPLSTRAEGTSTIWRYRAEECSLDIYFFLDVADNQRRALSYELIPPQSGARAAERCYQALKAASTSR